ncbi:MAG: RNA methyltransferase [Christensenellaceae bacterium]|nr:RNA methyltransferase [Christensenellaceae bacterium]
MSGVILSVQNDFVRTARTLKDKKGRMQQRAFLVEGVKCVSELLAHKPALLRTLIVTEDAGEEWAARANSLGRRAVTVAPHVMAAICDTKTPQAVAAVAALPEPAEISRGFIVAMDDVQDPANVGTIIRTADAAGCGSVVLSEGSADPYAPKAVRASMGSLFHLPVLRTQLKPYLIKLQEAGYQIACADLDGQTDFTLDAEKTCLVIGNESRGISREILTLSDVRVRIPIYGKAESLNAAVAAGILIYKIRS